MKERLHLQEQFRRGAIDKHEYSRAMTLQHETLSEYVELLLGSDIAQIEISADGIRMRSRLAPVVFPFDPIDRGSPCMVALNFGRYERPEFDMWKRLVPAGATVADIGANIGWYTVHMAANDAMARIFAFEPVPDSFNLLSRAVAQNGLGNVVVEQLALADHPGTMVIHVDPTIAGAASAHPSVYQDTSTPVLVQVTTLDEYADARQLKFDAVKLDVEGGELAVLQGARAALTRDRPMVFAEMLRRHARAFGYHPNDIIAFMDALGYACFHVAGAALAPFHIMDDDTTQTNFFFLHRIAHAAAIETCAVQLSQN
jgi:FkbM family methyltransferase